MSRSGGRWTIAAAALCCALGAGADEIGDEFVRSGWDAKSVAFSYEVEPPPVSASPEASASGSFFATEPCERCGRRTCFGNCAGAAAGGSLRDRTTLTGDWGGTRSAMAANGVVFQADTTQFYYGVASGGVDREFRYGAHDDYVMLLDGDKLLGAQGFFVKLRAEHRWGESLAGATGALLPSNVAADLPTRESDNLYLTNVLLTQALSENLAVYAGKLDTLDGDANAFASGRGKTQFSNVGFVVNPSLLRAVPYSTLGAGFIVLDQGEPIFNFGVLNALDTARSTGFGKLFEEGAVVTAEGRIPTYLLGMPGHQTLGGTWSSRNFVALGQDPRIVLPNVPIDRQSGTSALYWNCDQYLVTYDEAGKLGWGLFARAGLADEQANPIGYFLSGGLGGNSPIAGRGADTFGAGWYYAGTSSDVGPFLAAALGPIGDGQAVELFYNAEVTPWLHVTPDFQVVMPAVQSVDAAVVTGVRAHVAF